MRVTVDDLLKKWLGKEGGAERANYQMFLTELTQAIGLPTPDPKGSGLGDYQFEAPVRSEAALGTKGTGRIDLYKRDCFILEAKQSQVKPGEPLPEEPAEAPPETIHDLFGNPIGIAQRRGRSIPRYDRLMADARIQAERYALALPGDHKAPPFLIVADVGRSFELYFDWSGNGRGYGPFPDERGYRIRLEDLASDAQITGLRLSAAELLRKLWLEPTSIDPRLKAAEVTRQVAERLSRVAAFLEKTKRLERPDATDQLLALGIEQTSLFVMRLLFCMFAEDVELLPKGKFTQFLREARDEALNNPKTAKHFWRTELDKLWSMMSDPAADRPFWSLGRSFIRYFNGNLFLDRTVFDLEAEFIGELVVAGEKEWKNVEPAIFGTLLEQVLTSTDRAKLGAHYTPRPYVERLVHATIFDVLRPEWDATLAQARVEADVGDTKAAIATARRFHERLSDINVLDPACGTGNFLYVAMEQLLRLETEVRQFVVGLGGSLDPKVHPNQFLGLELNPRAAVIAELVLWIGWLRYRLANAPEAIGEPVLPPLSNINQGTHGGYDSVLVRTATGEPDTENPRRPEWPEADFIIGNPPFIGGKDIRERLGGDYAEALWKANPRVPRSADFVMHWWDRAADILTRPGKRLKRFGLVTTNSITQVFSRKVIEGWLAPPGAAQGDGRLSLVLAVPDHPWTRATKDAAAVRISMTVAETGVHHGRLVEIVSEAKLDTDEPELDERVTEGRINADLTVGADIAIIEPLKANEGICSPGVKLHGAGFIVTPAKAKELGLGTRQGLEKHIRPYLNGRDLLQRPRGVMVIDPYGLDEKEMRTRFPEVYQHLLETVKPERDRNRDRDISRDWWLHGRARQEWRAASAGLSRYITTVETAKHRIFHILDAAVLPDNRLLNFALSDFASFGVLSSTIHVAWALAMGGTLEDRPVYTKTVCFDAFAFPEMISQQQVAISEIAEELDSTRRIALSENDRLTLTGLYNLVESVRSGRLSPDQEALATRARALIVAKLHDDLDVAVADAYGWAEQWRRAPLPPKEIVARLMALNAQRAAEEAKGKILWLRPDYQKARFGKK